MKFEAWNHTGVAVYPSHSHSPELDRHNLTRDAVVIVPRNRAVRGRRVEDEEDHRLFHVDRQRSARQSRHCSAGDGYSADSRHRVDRCTLYSGVSERSLAVPLEISVEFDLITANGLEGGPGLDCWLYR